MLKPFLIAPYDSGLVRDREPWIIPEDAFEELEDTYTWRGKIRKRHGYKLIGSNDLNSRLRINIGTTAAVTGDFSTTVPGTIFSIGQIFSIGTTIFTVNASGSPAAMLTTGTATGTYDTATGALVITGNNENPSTAVYFYPADPVMGLLTRENAAINAEDIVGFDTQFSYSFDGTAWNRIDTGASATWTGNNSQFFWSLNARGSSPQETYFYVVNYNRSDHIRYLPQGSSTWTDLRPQLDAGATRYLDSALILVYFKGRMIALNTLETDGVGSLTFINRARFSQIGDPTAAATSWIDEIGGDGGFVDAPIQEAIITADFVKDHLIVYFERSTWELVYTGNPSIPFVWNQLNNELGAESTFSVIGFDNNLVGVGNVGIHACNGVNVSRIDQKIPDLVFEVHNGNSGPERVYGIRDYALELVYWAYPDAATNPTFPNKILIYNYINRTWATFNDSFTVFGYYQPITDITWAELGDIYGTWENWNDPWNSYRYQSSFPDIVGGNQQGFVVVLDDGKSTNDESLYITDMDGAGQTFTVINHNLQENDYILVTEAEGITSLNNTIVQINQVTNANEFRISDSFSGTYTGGGKITRVSNIGILTKQYNFGSAIGREFSFPYIDFLVSTTENGEVSVDYRIDARPVNVQNLAPPNTLLGSHVLDTSPQPTFGASEGSAYLWQRYFCQTQGSFIQLHLYMDDNQMRDISISGSDFELHAMTFYVKIDGRITG